MKKQISNLPDRDTVVVIDTNIFLTSFREIRGSVFHVVAAKVLAPAACSTPLDVTYVVGDDDLILHKWYLIPDNQQARDLREIVRQHFCSYAVV